ncbi:hypothetical protein E4U15_000073 [Claviceps sp. LM218 group G6]|nr:hypothetical protein E4U15_000073 [Claviceps sp. LM218 group G6]
MSSPDEPDWAWFPNVKSAWSLDVVNLLVVIGESAIAEHAQAITASLPGMLPRILPAPQALLKPSRPTRMPETHARMTGVYSGTTLDSVGFFANIITPLDTLPPFSFKVLEIRHSDSTTEAQFASPVPDTAPTMLAERRVQALAVGIGHFAKRLVAAAAAAVTRTGHAKSRNDDDDNNNNNNNNNNSREKQAGNLDDAEDLTDGSTSGGRRHHRHGRAKQPHQDEESGPPIAAPFPRRQPTVQFQHESISNTATTLPVTPSYALPPHRRSTVRERAQDLLTSPTIAVGGNRPAVPAKLFSPVHILSIFSCLLSIAILTTAVLRRDGTAILAISLLSLASTVVGYASFWRPILMKRKHTNQVPRGDVLIRTREGAFVLVHCSEEVARELYSGTEECEYYVGGNTYRALMALGTMLLMLSVVLLGNCTWELKVFIGASYIVLNGLYWGLGMIPRAYFWDLSRYEWADVTPRDALDAHKVTQVGDQREGHPSFTRTLWYAIRETQLTGWVERSGAAPSTEQWRKWLREAEEAAKRDERAWPAVQRKNDILKETLRRGDVLDRAAQHAPATEVKMPADPWNNSWSKDGTF